MKTPQVDPPWKYGIWNGKNVMVNHNSKPDSVSKHTFDLKDLVDPDTYEQVKKVLKEEKKKDK